MKLRDDINEFGTPITWFKCEYCSREFWVCPAVEDENLDYWRGCLWNECESYDPNRDVDALMFFEAIEIDKRDASTPGCQSDGAAGKGIGQT